jgi:hypothetical protein
VEVSYLFRNFHEPGAHSALLTYRTAAFKIEEDLQHVEQLLDKMHEHMCSLPCTFTYGAALRACARRRPVQWANVFLNRMRSAEVPVQASWHYAPAVVSCKDVAEWQQVLRLRDEMKQYRLKHIDTTCTEVMSAERRVEQYSVFLDYRVQLSRKYSDSEYYSYVLLNTLLRDSLWQQFTLTALREWVCARLDSYSKALDEISADEKWLASTGSHHVKAYGKDCDSFVKEYA